MEVKTCTKCGRTFPKTEDFFYKQGKYLSSRCRECVKAHVREYRKSNPEKVKASWQKWANEHREYLAEKSRQYEKEHADEVKEKKRERWKRNKEKYLEANKKWIAEHREYLLNYYKEYHKAHPEVNKRYEEAHKGRSRQYARDHKLEIREYQKNSQKYKMSRRIAEHRRRAKAKSLLSDFSSLDWEKAKAEFSFSCAYCGAKVELQQDHFVPLSKGGNYVKGNIVPACSHCNISKSNRNGIEWYRKQSFFNEQRENHILQYLGKAATA